MKNQSISPLKFTKAGYKVIFKIRKVTIINKVKNRAKYVGSL